MIHFIYHELVFVSDVFLLALLSHENLNSMPKVVSDTAVSSTEAVYSFMSLFFICLVILLSLLTFFFQIDRLEPSFADSVFRFRFRFRDSVSVTRFRIPCFSAAQTKTPTKEISKISTKSNYNRLKTIIRKTNKNYYHTRARRSASSNNLQTYIINIVAFRRG